MQQRGTAGSAKLERLLSVQLVLQESLKIRQSNEGRNPNVYQVLGKIALVYGLNSQELKQAASTMCTVWINYKDSVTWDGRPNDISTALRMAIGLEHKTLPSAAEEFLHKQRVALTSREIASGLKIDFKKTKDRINNAMQLLETAMFTKKLPLMNEIGNVTQLSVWVHRAYNPKIMAYGFSVGQETHFRNVQMEILNQLFTANRGRLMTELYRKSAANISPNPSGNPNAIYSSLTAGNNAKLLEENDLIKMTPIRAQLRNPRHGYRNIQMGTVKDTGTSRLELTTLGKKLWGDALRTGILSEELRILLLGEKELPNLEPQNWALIKRPD